jgi:hypothetical protein
MKNSSTDDNIIFMDFSDDRKPIRFAANGKRYDCHEAISIPDTQLIAGLASDATEENLLTHLDEFFNIVMDEDNAARIQAHMRDRKSPLTGDQAVRVMKWILEEYGQRPLENSSDSSDG